MPFIPFIPSIRSIRYLPPMTALRLLGLAILFGCARGPGSIPAPAAAAGADSGAVRGDLVCERRSAVLVHVDNQSTMDVEISFGSYTAARAAPGMSRTTYRVQRTYLQSRIRLRILRGGLQQGPSPTLGTEPVVCNDATLIIGPEPRYSFFYGDLYTGPSRDRRDDSAYSSSARSHDPSR